MSEAMEISQRPVSPHSNKQLTASDIRQRVNIIQEVMAAVMKRDVHYGIIPGCKKPSLYKPGSEVLLATFQIATSIHVEDCSTEDYIRYRVRVIGTHAPSGIVVGEGVGECSSNEEKYKWRKAYDEEWAATSDQRRRIKFGKYKDKQVRTEPADVANTILKMAKKRAQIDMTLTATGASDCFDQDIEDLPEELLPREEPQRNAPPQQQAQQPKPVYTDGQFASNLSVWTDLIKRGERTSARIIAMVESKFVLTEEHKRTLNNIKPNGTEEQGEAS